MRASILNAVQTRRNNAGIVKYQHVAGTQVIRQIVKMTVLQSAAFLIHHQQARMVAGLHRVLRNQLLRQLIIKICY